VLLPHLLELFLALEILRIALLHILIHPLQPLLVLSHALSHVLLRLLLFVKYFIVIDLLSLLPFVGHLFLDVYDEVVGVPQTLPGPLFLKEGVSHVIAPDSAEYPGDLFFLNSIFCLGE